MKKQGFELPDLDSLKVDPARKIAEHIKNKLGLVEYQLVPIQGQMPPEWAAIFTKEKTKTEKKAETK